MHTTLLPPTYLHHFYHSLLLSQFLEWLLNKVREPSIIHDILWQFNCALASHPVQQIAAKVKAAKEKDDNEQKNDKV